MAVIDVWYDPARGIGSTALDSYLAEFVGERSRMNMLMMEQRLKEADPTFLNEEIRALNDQLGRLYEARAQIINTQETGRLNVFNSLVQGEQDLRQVEMQGRVEDAKIQGQLQKARMEERGKAYAKRQGQEQDYRSSLELTNRDASIKLNDYTRDAATLLNADPQAGPEAMAVLAQGRSALAEELGFVEGDVRGADIAQYHTYRRLIEKAQSASDPDEANAYRALANAVREDKAGPFGGNDPDLVMQAKYGVMPEEEFREDVDWITQGGAGVNLGDYERTSFDELQETAGLGSPYETEGIDQQIAALQAQIRRAEAQKAALPKPEDVLFRGVTGNYLLDPVFTSAHSDQRYIEQAETLSPMERKDSLSYMATTDSPMEAVYKARDMGGLVDTTQNVAAIQNVGMDAYAWVGSTSMEIQNLLEAGDYQKAMAEYSNFINQLEALPPEMMGVFGLDIDGNNAVELLRLNYDQALARAMGEPPDPEWWRELEEGVGGALQLSMEAPRDVNTSYALWVSGEIARLEEMRRAGDEVGYFEGIDALYSQVSAMDPALTGESGDAFLRMVESGRESGDGSLMAANILNLGRHTQDTYFDMQAARPGVDEDPESFDPDREEREAMRVDVEMAAEPPRGVTADIVRPSSRVILEEPETWVEDPGPLPDPGEIDLGTALSTWITPDGAELQVDLGDIEQVKAAQELGAEPADLPTPEPENMPTSDGLVRDLSDEERILSEMAGTGQ